MIPPCFAHPSRDVPLRVRVPHPCAVMGAPSAFGRPRTLCARLRDHVPPSVPRPFSAAGTLCCGLQERTLPILACDFYFRSNTAKIIQQAQNSVKENRLRAKRRNCCWWKQSRMSAAALCIPSGFLLYEPVVLHPFWYSPNNSDTPNHPSIECFGRQYTEADLLHAFFKRAKKICRLAKTARTFFVRAVSVSIINQLKLWIVSACLHTLAKSCGHFPLCIY